MTIIERKQNLTSDLVTLISSTSFFTIQSKLLSNMKKVAFENIVGKGGNTGNHFKTKDNFSCP